MQINRLFEIVYILLERRKITAKELAEKFEVSTRTIYRDIDILSSANIPIYCNKGKGGGIGLLDNFILDKSLISENEQNEILSALQGLKELNVLKEKDTLEKMSRIFNKNTDQWIDIDFSDWGTYKEKDNRFEIIKKAILNHQLLQFIYYNSNGESKERIVEPLQIKFKDKAWYLIGYCREKQDYRIFKILRIKDIQILEENFNRRLPEQKEETYEIKNLQLKLLISKKLSYRIYDEFKPEEITQIENGDFIINVEYPNNDWVYGYLLSFGENIKILEPKYIREEILEKAKKLIENNKI